MCCGVLEIDSLYPAPPTNLPEKEPSWPPMQRPRSMLQVQRFQGKVVESWVVIEHGGKRLAYTFQCGCPQLLFSSEGTDWLCLLGVVPSRVPKHPRRRMGPAAWFGIIPTGPKWTPNRELVLSISLHGCPMFAFCVFLTQVRSSGRASAQCFRSDCILPIIPMRYGNDLPGCGRGSHFATSS